jgi:uncharacterized membrane protein
MDETKEIINLPLEESEISRQDIIDAEFKQEQLESNKQDRTERKKYAIYIFCFLCAFLGITLAIVIFTAIELFCLSDTILITLLTTTSADIIGVFIIVVKYLFKPNK